MGTSINIKDMELPEFDIVRAVPIKINLTKDKYLLFEIPTVDEYFEFEAKYLKFIVSYFYVFKDVNFIELKDFEDEDLKIKMIKEIQRVFQINKAKKEFIKIIKKYFKANFNINKILKYINMLQLAYLFLFIHKVVETVKKKIANSMGQINQEMSAIFSTSLNEHSKKIEPRF